MNKTDIFKAIEEHDLNRVMEIISQGFNVNIHTEGGAFLTPLLDAIDEIDYGGSIEMVRLLIQAGADVNAWDLYQASNPLIKAMWGEHDDVVRLLLEVGADPNVKDKEGDSLLRCYVERENVDMVKLLLNCGAKKTINEAGGLGGMNALGIAVSKLNIPIIKILLDAGANPELADNDYRKPIDRLPRDIDTDIREKIQALLKSHINESN